MRTPRNLLASSLALAAAFVLASCGKSPVAPRTEETPPPTPEIRTPTKLILQQIVVRKFPAKKTSGSDWDASLVVNSRKPDLYIVVGQDGGLPVYSSDVRDNATPGNIYRFTYGYGTSNLPISLPYGSQNRVYLMDRDVGGDNDRLGWITLNMASAYPDDNSSAVSHRFSDSGNRIEIEIVGTWDYR